MFRPNQMGVYIHWPFCEARCPYCDFNAHVRDSIDQDDWGTAYLRAIEYYADILPDKQVVSIFFGGGTPSLMQSKTVEAIIDKVQASWSVANDIEISLETNPTSAENDKFAGFKDAGVNRVSLGVQALDDEQLAFLGRTHDLKEALAAIELAKKHFDRFSFDLIYARPDQTMAAWEKELTRAIELSAGHLSLYQLTIERNTPFYMRHSRGEFAIPDDVAGADFYELTQDITEAAAMPAYEVSNHAQAGHECRHNQIYWHMADYIGIGAGAHGRFIQGRTKYATRDHAAPEIWKDRVTDIGHGAHAPEHLTNEDIFHEILMMGLRLKEGISLSSIEERTGLSFFNQVDPRKFKSAVQEGWIVQDQDRIHLSRQGMLRLNALVSYLLT